MLNSRNAIAICTLAGFSLGLSLAIILGLMFSTAGSAWLFEMGFYVFAGVVGGSAIGGLVGYILSGVLPDSSSERSGEQIYGGVFTAIGGFFIACLGVASFFHFHGGGTASSLPRIVLAVYELLGKWGLLIVLGGGGVAMLVGGVRSMIPEPAPKEPPKKRKKKKKATNRAGGPPELWE